MAMMMMERPRTRFFPFKQVERKPELITSMAKILFPDLKIKMESIVIQKEATVQTLKEAQVQLDLGLALKKKLKVELEDSSGTSEEEDIFQERLREIENMIGDAMSEISKAEVAMQNLNSQEVELKAKLERLEEEEEMKEELEKNERERLAILGLGSSFGFQGSDQQVKESCSLLENEVTQPIQMSLNVSRAPVITTEPTRIRMPPPPPKKLGQDQEDSSFVGGNSAGGRQIYPTLPLSVPATLIELSPMISVNEDDGADGGKSAEKSVAKADKQTSTTCRIWNGAWEAFVGCMISVCGEC